MIQGHPQANCSVRSVVIIGAGAVLGMPDVPKMLRAATLTESVLPALLEDLARKQAAVASGDVDPEGILALATAERIAQAVERYRQMIGTAPAIVKQRQMRKYRVWFAEAQDEYGNGLIGLIPLDAKRGNRRAKVPDVVLAEMEAVIAEAAQKNLSPRTAYKLLQARSQGKDWVCPADDTFFNRMRLGFKERGIEEPPETMRQRVAKRRGRHAKFKGISIPEHIASLRLHPAAAGATEEEINWAVAKYGEVFMGAETDLGERAKRKYRARFDAAQTEHGNGLIGLLPQIKNRGNRASKLPPAVRQLVADVIAEGTRADWGRSDAYRELADRCRSKRLKPPSSRCFYEKWKAATESAVAAARLGP